MKTESDTAAPVEAPVVYHAGISRLAKFLTVWTFFVVAAGGNVKSREAGLSIPEGFIFHWIQEWWRIPNLREEFFHRMLVGLLGAGVAVLTVWILMRETRSFVRRLAIGASITVVLQAVLGYLTVRLYAHPPTSIPHAVLGQTFLGIMVCIAVLTSKRWTSASAPVLDTDRPSLRRLAIYALHAYFIQLLLGAAIRHDDMGLALREGRESVFYWHLAAHILGAIAVLVYSGRLIFRIFDKFDHIKELIVPAYAMMAFITIQIGLGVAAAALKVGTLERFHWPPETRVWIATSHQATGALLLSLCVFMWMFSRRHTTLPPKAKKSSTSDEPQLARASA